MFILKSKTPAYVAVNCWAEVKRKIKEEVEFNRQWLCSMHGLTFAQELVVRDERAFEMRNAAEKAVEVNNKQSTAHSIILL